jgi:hypothetical protein
MEPNNNDNKGLQESNDFSRCLDLATQIVESWPNWKQSISGWPSHEPNAYSENDE